jgi:uncharacterized protein YdeI (YjbR/CyaY-like superfamily)
MELEKRGNIKTFYAKTISQWRKWLLKNHLIEKGVWLVIYKKDADTTSISRDEALDQALCFGWIDSVANKRDEDSYYQYFAQRKPKSNWSGINKVKIARLMEEGQMHPSGLRMVELAKETGTWTALEDVEKLVIPDDLLKALKKAGEAYSNWTKFPASTKRGILDWIKQAKLAETRARRIEETARLAKDNIRANQYTRKK